MRPGGANQWKFCGSSAEARARRESVRAHWAPRTRNMAAGEAKLTSSNSDPTLAVTSRTPEPCAAGSFPAMVLPSQVPSGRRRCGERAWINRHKPGKCVSELLTGLWTGRRSRAGSVSARAYFSGAAAVRRPGTCCALGAAAAAGRATFPPPSPKSCRLLIHG